MSGPARGYSWPPFLPANTAAVKHGARSPRVYGPVAEELAAGLLSERPDLAAYPEAVAAWADAEARADRLRKWLAETTDFDDSGSLKEGALKWLVSFDKRADSLRARLGRDPMADSELVRSRADATRSFADLDAVRAAGRSARLRAESRFAGALPAGSSDEPSDDAERLGDPVYGPYTGRGVDR